MAEQPSPEVLSAVYQARVGAVRRRVLAFAREVWVAQGTAFRDADVDRLVSVLVPRVQAGQLSIAKLTSQYIASLESVRSGAAVTARAVDAEAILGARGVPVGDVYRRPVSTIYTQLAALKSWEDAHAAGMRRLESIASMDMQLAKVRQGHASMRGSGFRFYRRTLSGNENCALCTIASTQRYKVSSVMPIHPGCDCGFEPIDRAWVPQVIDPALLEDTHGHVKAFAGVADRGGRSPDYRQLIITREHGEFGPTLAWRDQSFTGPDDLA